MAGRMKYPKNRLLRDILIITSLYLETFLLEYMLKALTNHVSNNKSPKIPKIIKNVKEARKTE
jgi:hypothetical protein